MKRLHVTRLAPDEQLARALADRAEVLAKPPRTPRQVVGMWMENAGVGAGAGVALGVLLAATGAPVDPISAGVTAGVLAWAGAMVWRGTLDEQAIARSSRHVSQAVRAIQRQADADVARMTAQLDDALDVIDACEGEKAQLQRALDGMTRERDMAVNELSRERTAAQQGSRQTYVPPVEVAPQELADATEMLRWRFQFGQHLSRRKADETKRWSQPRWEAAQKVLADARVIAVANGATQYPATLDDGLRQLGEYMIDARRLSAPAVNRALGVALYVEPE